MTTPDITDPTTFGHAIDWATVVDRFEGDMELLREVAALFLEDCPRRLTDLRDAVARGDAAALRRVAHSIKGSASNFAATGAVAAALRLEMMGRDGDFAHAEEACTALEDEIARLAPVLAHLVDSILGDGGVHTQS